MDYLGQAYGFYCGDKSQTYLLVMHVWIIIYKRKNYKQRAEAAKLWLKAFNFNVDRVHA
jgi:hypothetical protein